MAGKGSKFGKVFGSKQPQISRGGAAFDPSTADDDADDSSPPWMKRAKTGAQPMDRMQRLRKAR